MLFPSAIPSHSAPTRSRPRIDTPPPPPPPRPSGSSGGYLNLKKLFKGNLFQIGDIARHGPVRPLALRGGQAAHDRSRQAYSGRHDNSAKGFAKGPRVTPKIISRFSLFQ